MGEPPLFGEMHESLAYRRHLHAVRDEQAAARTNAGIMARVDAAIARHSAFDGTYPLPAGGRVAGRKNPPPPGGGP